MYFFREIYNNKISSVRGFMTRVVYLAARIKLGKNLKCDKIPNITVHKKASLTIGDKVILREGVEIRVTGKAKVIIGNNVKLDKGVRIIAANEAVITIGNNTAIGLLSVLNGGDSITVGEYGLISGFVYLQSSMHQHCLGEPVKKQGYDHAPVVLKSDVWLGAHATIMPGVTLGEGVVVGSNAVVTKSFNTNQIIAGVPAKLIGNRK